MSIRYGVQLYLLVLNLTLCQTLEQWPFLPPFSEEALLQPTEESRMLTAPLQKAESLLDSVTYVQEYRHFLKLLIT